MILPIEIYGSKILREEAINIEKSEDINDFISDMFETMKNSDGVGLSSTQVGDDSNLFIAKLNSNNKVFINPKIIEFSEEKQISEEGCLSFPGIHLKIERSKKVLIEYYDENWMYHKEWFEDFNAIVIQHEYDHLQGILFIDRISALNKKIIKNKLKTILKRKFKVNYKIN